MTNILPKPLRDQPFTYREAFSLGITEYTIRKLLASGDIERIERGLYRSVSIDISEEEEFRTAVKKIGAPSAICLLSALSYYELTDTLPNQAWLMVPWEKRTTSGNIKLYRARDPKWEIGVIAKDGYTITSLERTIVDALTHKSFLPTRIGLDALKNAITTKKTSLSRIINVSKSLGVMHRIIPYIEALS